MTLLLFVWLLLLLMLGACIGSYLNVCIYRIPYEKSTLWPGSRCGHCLQAIRWYDNIPLLSYWLLGGRCRNCGAKFSARYFVIELLTGLGFAGLFYLEVHENIHRLDMPGLLEARAIGLNPQDRWFLFRAGWIVFAYHAVLFCFLIVTSFCDMDHLEIPLPITITGTCAGLIGGTVLWTHLPAILIADNPLNLTFQSGVYPWPVWWPLPGWLPLDSWRTGLAAGLAGMLAGMLVLRGVRLVFGVGRGMEGMGVGDADLMMMAGSFLGWQPIVMAFFIAVFPALLFGIAQLFLRGNQALPFGPSLAIGTLIVCLYWENIGPAFQLFFFNSTLLLIVTGSGAVFLFVASLLLRVIRGRPS